MAKYGRFIADPPAMHDALDPIWAVMAGFFFLVNLVAPAAALASGSDIFVAVVLGSVAGQVGLLAIWGTLGPQHWPTRMGSCLLTGWIGYIAVYCSVKLGGESIIIRGEDAGAFLTGLTTLPILILAAQAPIWLLRVLLGLRIVARRPWANPPPDERRFGVSHLLAATACIAAAFGLARIGLNAGTQLVALLLLCFWAAIVSAFVAVPCLGWSWGRRGGTRLLLAYALFWPALHVVAAVAIARDPEALRGAVSTALFWIFALGTVHGVCRLVASHDFELVTARRLRHRDRQFQ